MWWDWSQITLLDSILFALAAMFVLYFVGFGTLRLISYLTRRSDVLLGFEFSIRTNFRLFFGFIFTFLFLYLFSIVNLPFYVSTIIILAITPLLRVSTKAM